VYSIDRVTAVSPDGAEVEYYPFYSFKHGVDASSHRRFWHATRRGAEISVSKQGVDEGSEVFLSFVDLDFRPSAPANWTVTAETTCLNRDLPRYLPFGGDQPRLQLVQGAPLSRVQCLTPPTPTRRPARKHGALWKLISHLSLNYLSIVGNENVDAADAFQEILRLYDVSDSAETRSMIEGILSVKSRRTVAPVGDLIRGAFCRGVEVSVCFDEDRFVGSGLFLFASVLERFLGLYCSVNSFTKMVATTKQRKEELCRWAPRAGERILA
jgi:type VI secretion system protein ImpG